MFNIYYSASKISPRYILPDQNYVQVYHFLGYSNTINGLNGLGTFPFVLCVLSSLIDQNTAYLTMSTAYLTMSIDKPDDVPIGGLFSVTAPTAQRLFEASDETIRLTGRDTIDRWHHRSTSEHLHQLTVRSATETSEK